MTLEELSKELNYSVNTLKRSFNRTKESLAKNKGIIITKNGYGETADYQISYDKSIRQIKTPQKKRTF